MEFQARNRKQIRDPDQEEGPDLEIGPERGLHGLGERRFLLRDIHQAEARGQEGDPSRATRGHQVEESEVFGMGQSRNPPAEDELGQQVAHHRQDGCEGEGPFQAAGPALQARAPLQALVHVDDGGGVRQPQDQPLTDDHPQADRIRHRQEQRERHQDQGRGSHQVGRHHHRPLEAVGQGPGEDDGEEESQEIGRVGEVGHGGAGPQLVAQSRLHDPHVDHGRGEVDQEMRNGEDPGVVPVHFPGDRLGVRCLACHLLLLPSRYVETDIIGHCAAAVAPRSVADRRARLVFRRPRPAVVCCSGQSLSDMEESGSGARVAQ